MKPLEGVEAQRRVNRFIYGLPVLLCIAAVIGYFWGRG